MLTELIVLAAVVFLQYKVHAFLGLCVLCFVASLASRRPAGDEPTGWRASRLAVVQAVDMFRRLLITAMIVVAAACGFRGRAMGCLGCDGRGGRGCIRDLEVVCGCAASRGPEKRLAVQTRTQLRLAAGAVQRSRAAISSDR